MSQPDTIALLGNNYWLQIIETGFAEQFNASHRTGPAPICLKISARIAERETYRLIPVKTRLFSHWSIPLRKKHTAFCTIKKQSNVFLQWNIIWNEVNVLFDNFCQKKVTKKRTLKTCVRPKLCPQQSVRLISLLWFINIYVAEFIDPVRELKPALKWGLRGGGGNSHTTF